MKNKQRTVSYRRSLNGHRNMKDSSTHKLISATNRHAYELMNS